MTQIHVCHRVSVNIAKSSARGPHRVCIDQREGAICPRESKFSTNFEKLTLGSPGSSLGFIVGRREEKIWLNLRRVIDLPPQLYGYLVAEI